MSEPYCTCDQQTVGLRDLPKRFDDPSVLFRCSASDMSALSLDLIYSEVWFEQADRQVLRVLLLTETFGERHLS